MLDSKIIRNYIIFASSCMLVLASISEIPEEEAPQLSSIGGHQEMTEELQQALSRKRKRNKPLAQEIFISDPEEGIKKKSVGEAYEALMNSPASVFTQSVLKFINTPMFYGHLSPEKFVNLWKHLCSMASDNEELKVGLEACNMPEISIYHNLDKLNNNEEVVGKLLDSTKKTNLELIQYFMLLGITEYNVELSLKFRQKLAKLVLLNPKGTITERLCLLKDLGYFKDFLVSKKEGILRIWSKSAMDGDKSRMAKERLVSDILSPIPVKPKGDSEAKIFELLNKISLSTDPYEKIEILLLQCFHHMLHVSPSADFLSKIYKILAEMG